MKPVYKKKAKRSTRGKKDDRAIRKNSPRVRVEVEAVDLGPEPVFVNRVTLDNTIPGGFYNKREPVPQPERA